MKLNFFPLAFIIYTNKLPQDWADGWCYGLLILIRPEHKNNKGLHAHELFHSTQFWLTLGIHSILYRFIPKYKYWSEVLAYRKQLKYSPNLTGRFVQAIVSNYKLDVSEKQVLKDLSDR